MDRRRIQSAGAPKRPPKGMISSAALPSELLASIRIDLAADSQSQNNTISPLELHKRKADQSLYLQNMKMKMKTKRRASYNPLNYATSNITNLSCLSSSGIQSKDQTLVDNRKAQSIQKRKILVVKKQINAFPPDFFAWSNDTSVIKKTNSLENSEKMNKSSQGIHGIYDDIIDSSFAEKPSDFSNEFMEPSSQLSTKNTSVMQAERKYIEDSNFFFGKDHNGGHMNLASTGVFQVDDCLVDESRFSTEFTPRKELQNITSNYNNNRKASDSTNIFSKQSNMTANWNPASLKAKPPKPTNSCNTNHKNIFKRDSDIFSGTLINNYSSNHRKDQENRNQLEMLEQKCTFGIFPVENKNNKQKNSISQNQSINKENGGYSISTPVMNNQLKPNHFKQSSYSVKQQQQFPVNPLNSVPKPVKNIADRFLVWNQKIPDAFKPMKSRCNSTHLHNLNHYQSCNTNSDNTTSIPSKMSLQTIDSINPNKTSFAQDQNHLQLKTDLPSKSKAPQGGLAKRRSYSYKQELLYQSEAPDNYPAATNDFLKNYFSEAGPSSSQWCQEQRQKHNETLDHTREVNSSQFSRRNIRSKRSLSHKEQSTDKNKSSTTMNQNIYEFSFNKTTSMAAMNDSNLRGAENNNNSTTVTPFAVLEHEHDIDDEQSQQKENIPPTWGFNHTKSHPNKENHYSQTQKLNLNKSNHSATLKMQQHKAQPNSQSSKQQHAQKPTPLLFSSKVLQFFPM